MFSRADLDFGYLIGEGDEPRIVRAVYVHNPSAEAIASRARAGREAGRLLTGHAAGHLAKPTPR